LAEPPKRPARPSQPVPRPSTAGRPSNVDRALALRDVVQHAISTEKEFQKKSVTKRSNTRLVAMLAVAIPLLGLSIWSWVARPAFIWGGAPAMAPVQETANLRVTLYVLGLRIKQYRAAQGYFPASLEVLGENVPGVTYQVVSDSVFELRAVAGRQPVIFRSDMNAKEYLGNARDLISNRSPR
jgi:hypothetical protein